MSFLLFCAIIFTDLVKKDFFESLKTTKKGFYIMTLIRRHKRTIITTCVTTLFLFIIMLILRMEPFGSFSLVNYDCQSQVYPLLCVLHDKLRSGDSLLFAWNAGLGDGFLPTFFYYLSSPINFLVVLVDKSDIRAFVNITIFLRLVLSSMFMSVYLSNRYNQYKSVDESALTTESTDKGGEENESGDDSAVSEKVANLRSTDKHSAYIIPLSIAYALSGFVFGFYHEVMWLDSYMVFPLIMLGYDKLMRDRKPALYILSLVYSSICSFYMTFMIGVFLVLWFVLDTHTSIKDFFKKAVLFGISSALAIGMTAMSLLVSYIGVMKTHVQDEPDIVHQWFGNVFNIIRYQFTFATPINVSYDNNCANLYCGLFVISLTVLYVFTGRIKLSDRIKRIALIIFIFVSLNESLLNFFWHGLHYQLCIPNRFSFLLIFLLLITAYDALIFAENVKCTILCVVLAGLFPLVCYFFTDFDSLIDSKVALGFALAMMFVYSTFIILNVATDRKLLLDMFVILMTCEILANAFMSLAYDISDATRYDEVLTYAQSFVDKYERDEKGAFYRSKFLGTNVKNAEYILDINGMAIYNSLISSNVLTFSENNGYFRTDVSIDENGGFEPLDDIIGVKYLYSVKEPLLGATDYELIDSVGDVSVYRNNNALSLGYAVSREIENVTSDKTNVIDNINKLSTAMTGCADMMEEVIPQYSVTSEGIDVQYADTDYLYMQFTPNGASENPFVRVSFDAEEDGLYNVYMNYSDYAVITVTVNNETRRYEYTSFGGVLNLGRINKGDKVDMLIQSESNMADGFSAASMPTFELRLEKINDETYRSFIEYLKKGEMNISHIADGRIESEVTLSDDQLLFTTIPYDESWHVYENGKELTKKKLAGAFVGLDLGEGTHELEFKFVPEGLYTGLIISIVSWILFVGWTLYLRKFRLNTK